MPSFSERQRLLWQLRRLLEFEIVAGGGGPGEVTDRIYDILSLYVLVSHVRYIDRWRDPDQERHRDVYARTAAHMNEPDRDFYTTFRMTKSTFNSIHSMISDLALFHNDTGRRQTPSLAQFAVAVFRFTHNGNAASVKETAKNFGCTEGSVHAFTTRIIAALLLIEKDVHFWPSADERRSIATAFAKDGVPGGCVGLVDGVHIILDGKPHRPDGNDMRNRNGLFSFNVMGVVDHTKRIRFLHTGFAGRRHDSVVYDSSSLARQPERFFSAGEYILGDSAYPTNDHSVPLFIKEQGEEDLERAEEAFNTQMARVRVRVEHTFGILKLRFSSLQGLRVRLRNARDEKRCTAWIRACVVLHNLMRPIDDEAIPTVEEEEGFTRAVAALQASTGQAASDVTARDHWRRLEVMRELELWTEQDGYLI